MVRDDMVLILGNHPDFKNELTQLEHFIRSRGHICYFIPKFHCDLNPIERYWALSMQYTRSHCNYSIVGLRRNIPLALDSVSLDTTKKIFDRVRLYMYCYLIGLTPGSDLEDTLKSFRKTFKSHRKISASN